MRRLYLQIYAALIGILIVLTLLIGLAIWSFDRNREADRWLGELTEFTETILPPAGAPQEDVERVLMAFADPLELDGIFFSESGEELFRFGEPHDIPEPVGPSRWVRDRGPHRILILALSDGRRLIIDGHRDNDPRPIAPLVGFIVLLGLATAVVAYPITRRLTRRLETLKQNVDDFGSGQLDLRAPIEGHDEIADLARSFNATAEHVQGLISDKSRLLADTSHELRTPLTRVRMALELLRQGPRPELLDRIDQDIEELDDLIGELLMASRLDAPDQALYLESIDLLALIAEESARHDRVELEGLETEVLGDRRLLRRLFRNLIENGLRHGQPPVEISLTQSTDSRRVTIRVTDQGPGLPPEECDRIFEPFYRPPDQSNAAGGIGLGLSLVRRIAERHGGRVWCESSDENGTSFMLELPRGGPDETA